MAVMQQNEVTGYVKTLTDALREEFGERLLYVGLQGSCMRGEATENSDIDIMAVLDVLNPADMDAYRRVVKSLEYADRSCGFLCGRKDLLEWNRCEICHLVHTTRDCFGRLDGLVPEYTKEDVLEYIRIMTGNLYHALCHSRVHGKEAAWENMLQDACKQAFFILQNKRYVENGTFAVSKAELLELLSGTDARVLEQAMGGKSGKAGKAFRAEGADLTPEQRFALLFDWCRQTLVWAADRSCGRKVEKEST